METVPKSPGAGLATCSETAAVAALPTTEVPTAVDGEIVGSTSGQAQGTSGDRKRGRPEEEEAPPPQAVVAKRGRGRPKGTGKLQRLASFGGLLAETAGANFTPYIMVVNAGEDITNKVLQFNEQFSKSTCVLSALGSVSRVDLGIPGSANSLRYEGHFDIIYFSASHTLGGRGEKITVLSINLVDPHGTLFGGKVTGPMIAAGPVQIILGAFVQEMRKKQRVGGASPLQPIPENEVGNGEAPENENQIPGNEVGNGEVAEKENQMPEAEPGNGEAPETENQIPEELDVQPDNEENSELPKSSSPSTDEIRVPSSNGGDTNVNAP